MRNLKKFLAVLVVVVMIASTFVTAFAADANTTTTTTAAATKTDADTVKDLGVLQGSTNGVDAAYLAAGTLRYQAAILTVRLLGKEADAKKYTGTDNFADVAADKTLSAENKAILGYLKANPSLGWVGDKGNFNPMGKASAQMIYKVILTALGYAEGTDFNYSDTVGFAKAVGLKKISTVTSLTNNDLATALVEGLKATVKGKTSTLATDLIAAGLIDSTKAVAAGFAAPTPASLDFTLSTDNYKEITVTFNRAIDNAKLTDKNNYSINGATPTKVVASADNKTAVLTLATALKQQADQDVIVKAGAGLAADTKKTLAGFADTKVPTIVSTSVVGSSKIIVTYSEPVVNTNTLTNAGNYLGNYKIDGNFFAGNVKLDDTARVATVTVTNYLSAGTHKLVVSNVTDFGSQGAAGFVIASNSNDIVVAADTAPATVSVVSATQTKVVVKFSKGVDVSNASIASTSGTPDTANASLADDSVTYTIPFPVTSSLPASGSPTITITGIKTLYGVSCGTLTVTPSITADIDRPTVKTITATNDTSNNKQKYMLVTFSKDMAIDVAASGVFTNTSKTNDANEFVVKDSDGKTITSDVAFAKDQDSKDIRSQIKLTRNDGKNWKAGTYTVEVKNLVDNNPLRNQVLSTVQSVTVPDLLAPAGKNNFTASGNKLYVVFGAADAQTLNDEKLDPATVLNPANYQVNVSGSGIKTLNSDTKLALMTDNLTIEIALPQSGDNAIAVGNVTNIQVSNIKDTAGNTAGVYFAAIGGPAAAGPALATQKVTGKNTVELVFNNKFLASSVVSSDYVVKDNLGNALGIKSFSYDADNMKVTLTTNEDFDANGTYKGANVAVYSLAQSDISAKDSLGQQMVAFPVGVANKILGDAWGPVASKPASIDFVKYNGTNTDITVEFNDNLTFAGGSFTGSAATPVQFNIKADGGTQSYSAAYTAASGSNKAKIVFTVTGDISGKTVVLTFTGASTATVTDGTNGLADFSFSNK